MTAKTLFLCNITTAFLSLIIAGKFIGGYGRSCSETYFFHTILTFCQNGCKIQIYVHASELFFFKPS